MIRRFVAGNPTTLLTLTTNPAMYETKRDAFLDVTRKVNHLFKRLRRRYPTALIQYALVWEVTKKGWPHAHLLLRAPFLPQALVSHLWQQLSGAKIVDIRAVSGPGHTASYVAKYLAKAPAVPPGFKRYRTSRAWAPADPTPRLRDFLDCGPFSLTRYDLKALQGAWEQDGLSTAYWMPWLLVAYAPQAPPSPQPLQTQDTPRTAL